MTPRIYILAFAAFAVGTEAHVFTGVLEPLAADLGIELGAAGWLAASFAITYAVAAPFMASFVAALDRKRILVGALFALGLVNLAGAVMPTFTLLLATRVLCGLIAPLVTPIASAVAAGLVESERRGRALSVVLAGITLAFVLGIPLGSVVGSFFGWRATFAFSGVLALLACVAIALILPSHPSQDRAGLANLRIALDWPVLSNLFFNTSAFFATFSIVAYIGPIITRVTGLEGAGIGAIQMAIGGGSIVGVYLGGPLADRAPKAKTVAAGFALNVVILGLYSFWMFDPLGLSEAVKTAGLAITLFVGSSIVFTLSPVIQNRLIFAAPQDRGLALALNGSTIFLGQGLGAAFAGLIVRKASLEWLGIAGAAGALLALSLALIVSQREERYAEEALQP